MPDTHSPLAPVSGLARLLPPLQWLRGYNFTALGYDTFAALLTVLVTVPQGIAFALLAGLPPEQGLYAGIVPPLAYALLGTSRTLLVGPVSVTAVMIAAALSAPGLGNADAYLTNTLVLACESGLLLIGLAALRLGALVNFISFPVLTGFTSGAAVLILWRLFPSLLGLSAPECRLDMSLLVCMRYFVEGAHLPTALLALGCLSMMLLWGPAIVRVMRWMGFSSAVAQPLGRMGPLLVVLISVLAVRHLHLDVAGGGVATVGHVAGTLPIITTTFLRTDTWLSLLPSALYVGLVGYVSTVAMAKVSASLRHERIDPNQEALALGAANIVAAFFGSMPVAGGMSQTMLKVAAGARTQVATIMTSLLVAVAMVNFSDAFAHIPKAALSSIIVVAILPLIKLRSMVATWRYQFADGLPETTAFLGVLLLGLEAGLVAGIIVTLLSYLWQSSRPHIAVVGRVRDTEHYRNITRHDVQTWPHLLLLRIDENLNFANAGYVEDFVSSEVARHAQVKHLVLICTSISHIDATGLRMLESLAATLKEAGITLHLSEVKGPVMDALRLTHFPEVILPGRIFFRTDEAIAALSVANMDTADLRVSA